MRIEQAESLRLGIPINNEACIYIESALLWVQDNTTLEININDEECLQNLPANVKLFVMKYFELMTRSEGVSSESIEGLSQSFSSEGKSALIWELAESLLGKWLKSAVSFVPAVNRWG